MNQEQFNALVTKFQELKDQETEIQMQKEGIALQLKEMLKAEGSKTFVSDAGLKATLVESRRFTYSDTPAIIKYVKSHGLSSVYLEETINTKKLNADIKTSQTLANDLNGFVTEQIVESLKVSN